MLDSVRATTAGAAARLANPGPALPDNATWHGPLAAHRRSVGDLNTATHHGGLARAVLARGDLFEGRLLAALAAMQVGWFRNCSSGCFGRLHALCWRGVTCLRGGSHAYSHTLRP